MSQVKTSQNQSGVSLTHEGVSLLFPSLPYHMEDRIPSAVTDAQLQDFVNSATLKKDIARRELLPAVFGDKTDAMRTLAGRIKQHTLDHLDQYIEQFVDQAEKQGVKVHFAKDGKQANAIITEIAKQENCKLCVKSKSMVTEETHLLPALEAVGCETVETDLGEFILQLDGDAPSHIVTPMIHKDRKAVARAFERELGATYTEDEKQLTMIAREHLREKYRQADLGISGGNFLVADTGSVVLCTNEGNGRFCTSVPRIHIACVGIEKLVPTYQHLAVLLKLLARSSTAQPLTCYTSILTGPKRADDQDGPEQMHIVLIDNGRSDILRAETREMLRCIRCGACLNACPVYRKVGGHSYGAVYSGPIGALITPMFRGLKNYKDLPNASSLCGACYEACPVKINIPRYLVLLREKIVTGKISGYWERLTYRLYAASQSSCLAYRWAQRFQKFALRFKGQKQSNPPRDPQHANLMNRKWVTKVPGPAAGWTQERDLPSPTSKSFRDWWQSEGCQESTANVDDRAAGKGKR